MAALVPMRRAEQCSAQLLPTEGTDPPVTKADVCVVPGMPPHDDDRFPLVWQAG